MPVCVLEGQLGKQSVRGKKLNTSLQKTLTHNTNVTFIAETGIPSGAVENPTRSLSDVAYERQTALCGCSSDDKIIVLDTAFVLTCTA